MVSRTEDKLRKKLIELRQSLSEDEVKSSLREMFSLIDSTGWRLQHAIGSSFADMVNFQHQIIIETKKRGQANPQGPGSGDQETQLDQLTRYVKGMVDQSLLFDYPESKNWSGYLTDGVHWWGWDWNDVTQSMDPIGHVQGLRMPQDIDQLHQFLSRFFKRESPAQDLPPDDLVTSIIEPQLSNLRDVQLKVEHRQFYRTKYLLWSKMLEGSGIIPEPHRLLSRSDVFLKHSLIVVFARMLVSYLGNSRVELDELISSTAEGFQGWIAEDVDGRKILNFLAEEVRRYQWRGATKDLLKRIYHGLIESKQRKEFGEYYTPDNLARRITQKVLDDDWCDDAIVRAARELNESSGAVRKPSKYLGVLDPSCGSGTFLFHAARRILDRINSDHVELLSQCPQIIARLVHGIDLHPVAVEMSKATLAMAIPATSGQAPALRVVMGDAMQAQTSHVFESLGLWVSTPGNRTFSVPTQLIDTADSTTYVRLAVQCALNQSKISEEHVPSELVEELQTLVNALTAVIAAEDNHIWSWHLENTIDFARITNDKVGCLIGNPPWLVENETKEGTRKKDIERMRKELGLKSNLRGSSAKGDLAATFTARVTDLYLGENAPNNRYVWVLPGSALINQTWEPWLDGNRDSNRNVCVRHEETWNLDAVRPPIFQHAPNGTCVVFGHQVKGPPSQEIQQFVWSGALETANVTRTKKMLQYSQSDYLPRVHRGAFYSPETLVLAIKVVSETDELARVSTQKGSRRRAGGRWFETDSQDFLLEQDALLPVLRSQDLRPFSASSSASLIGILNAKSDGFENPIYLKEKFPLLHAYWVAAEALYVVKRTEKSSSTLFENLDYRKYISRQLKCTKSNTRTKVIYNKAGSYLRAARVRIDELAGQTLYWLIADSEAEALFLLGILNAPCMQPVWLSRRTSKLDFHTSVFRNTPIPPYDVNSKLHVDVVRCSQEIEASEDKRIDLLDEVVRPLGLE